MTDNLDVVDDIMHQLCSRGRALLINGSLDDDVPNDLVQAWVWAQRDFNGGVREEFVVSLDTLETILRWAQGKAES